MKRRRFRMHMTYMKHKPAWYCVFDVNTLECHILDKVEAGGPKLNDGTSEQDMATNLQKISAQNRDSFISEMDAQGVNYQIENVKL